VSGTGGTPSATSASGFGASASAGANGKASAAINSHFFTGNSFLCFDINWLTDQHAASNENDAAPPGNALIRRCERSLVPSGDQA
jgi:hypothetical protein